MFFSDILKIAEILKEVILSKTNKNDELEFIERPKKYDGSRDPHAIESWIQSIEDYSSLKEFTSEKTTKLGVTLLTGAAKVWYHNLRLLKVAPNDWLHFKTELTGIFQAREFNLCCKRQDTQPQAILYYCTVCAGIYDYCRIHAYIHRLYIRHVSINKAI
jgi:hypothetical protein